MLRAHPEGAEGAGRALARALAIELVAPTLATELVLARATEGWADEDATRRAAEALRALGRGARAPFEEHPGRNTPRPAATGGCSSGGSCSAVGV